MGHGDFESKYGFGNYHAHDDFSHNHPADPTEQIYDDDFDKLIKDVLNTIAARRGEVGITLEACHADNLVSAKEQGKTHEEYGYPQSFLERLSAEYPYVTFSGTGPWSDSKNMAESLATDARASGGYPELTAPVTSTGGGIWKHGNTVIFHHHDNQIAVRKSPFSSTETAKNLKINTVNYAIEILNQQANLTNAERKEILARICVDRKILKIENLKPENGFPYQAKSENDSTKRFTENEKAILKQEQDGYLQRVQTILSKTIYTDRDVLMIALGLNHPSIFNGRDDVFQGILKNEKLLKLVMVSCGKVLIAGKDNNNVIDLLLKQGIPINSVDEKGMTALHYVVQNFYVYSKEPLNLINKLLEHGANPENKDNQGRTPLMIADAHSKKQTVIGGASALELLRKRSVEKHSVNTVTSESKITPSQAIILRSLRYQPGEKKMLAGKISSHDDSGIQAAVEEKRKNDHAAPASTDRKSTDDSSITYSGYRKK